MNKNHNFYEMAQDYPDTVTALMHILVARAGGSVQFTQEEVEQFEGRSLDTLVTIEMDEGEEIITLKSEPVRGD